MKLDTQSVGTNSRDSRAVCWFLLGVNSFKV